MDGVAGALRALFGRHSCDDPYPHYAVLREHAPVHPLGRGAVVVGRYADCDRVLRDPVFRVEDAEWMQHDWPQWREHHSAVSLMAEMVNRNPPDHERLRRSVSAGFTPRRITALEPAVRHLVDGLLARLEETAGRGGPVDFMAGFALPLPVTVIGELLGVPEQDRSWLGPQVEALTAAIEVNLTGAELAAADTATTALWAYLRDLIGQRRADPRDDLVSALVGSVTADADEFAEEELLANLVLLYSAGYETTSNLLANGLVALVEHPDHMARLRAEPQRTAAYVEEMLRYDPPIQVASRWAGQDTEVGGVPLPAHTQVVLLVGAANRDPERFDDPDSFLPERGSKAALAFGAGMHFCLGAALARLEAQTTFPRLLERFDEIRVAAGARRRGRSLRGYAELPLTLRRPARAPRAAGARQRQGAAGSPVPSSG